MLFSWRPVPRLAIMSIKPSTHLPKLSSPGILTAFLLSPSGSDQYVLLSQDKVILLPTSQLEVHYFFSQLGSLSGNTLPVKYKSLNQHLVGG